MATVTPPAVSRTTPAAVSDVLNRLRQQIRWYVVAEGVAMAVTWLVAAFWLGLALDYLPVRLGASEMPRTARQVVLGIALLGCGCVLYFYLFRRLFVPLSRLSLALLVERNFPEFCDSLVTTVERDSHLGTPPNDDEDWKAIQQTRSDVPDKIAESMFAQTVAHATVGIESVQLRRIFNFQPLLVKAVGAIFGLGTLIGFGALNPDGFATGGARLLLLSDTPWPRRSHIELVDFDDQRQRKIAKGTDLIIRIRAAADREFPAPTLCSILYETADGDRGRLNMSRDGEARDGFQYYVFNGKPFRGILDDIHFDVIGGDHRLRDCLVKAVQSPVVKSVQVNAELPAYTGLLARSEGWTPGLQLPIGSRVTAEIVASKDVVAAQIKDIDSGEMKEMRFPADDSQDRFEHQIPSLGGRVALAISLIDTDGISSLEPFVLTLGAIEDEIPQVQVGLRGIGSSITPNAILAVEGSVTDDYELARTWYQLQLESASREYDFELGSDDDLVGLDLRERAKASQQNPLQLKPQDQIVFSVKASDRFDLDGQTHVGSSDPTRLTIVRSDELLAILDGRELQLRRRFEQIRTEMVQSRDSLARLRGSFSNETAGEGDEASNLADLRERWASWATQKADQTALEVDGVALAFEDIREELINNRVDTPERKTRLEQQIIAPLHQITRELFPPFRQSLVELSERLRAKDAESEMRSIDVLENADTIIVAMDSILNKMLELEDYAEVVDLVRQIIEQQNNLLKQTKEEQESSILDLFK